MSSAITPSLLIGIGGTGSKTLIHLLDKIDEQGSIKQQKDYIKQLRQDGLVQMIAIDTDAGEQKDLEKLESDSKIMMSENIRLRDYIQARRKKDENNPLNQSFDWFPPEVNVGPIFYNANLQAGAGQIRMYSRIAFEYSIDRIKSVLSTAFGKLVQVNRTSIHTSIDTINVYVVCSIAGGTGSGSFLQMAGLIKSMAVTSNVNVVISGILLTADIYEKMKEIPANQKPNLYVNTYSCLKDLEAINKLCVREELRPPGFGEESMKLHFDPTQKYTGPQMYNYRIFDQVYLIEHSNVKGGNLNITQKAKPYEQMIADALYCLIFSPVSRGAQSTLNNTIMAMLDLDNRSLPMYGSLGSGRIVFPVKDIAKYGAYRFASEKVCEYWERLEQNYRDEMRDYKKLIEQGEDVKKPQRHDLYIRAVNEVQTKEAKPENAEVRAAFKHYERTAPKWVAAVEKKINEMVEEQLKPVATADYRLSLNARLPDVKPNTDAKGMAQPPSFHDDETWNENKLDQLLATDTEARENLATIMENYKMFSGGDSFPKNGFVTIEQLVTGAESWVSSLDKWMADKLTSIVSAIIREVLEDDVKARSGQVERIQDHKLLRWTQMEGKPGSNIYYLRYFLSKQLDELNVKTVVAEGFCKSLDEKYSKMRKESWAGENQTEDKLSGLLQRRKGGNWGQLFGRLFRTGKQWELAQAVSADLPAFVSNRIQLHLATVKKRVFQALRDALAYEDYVAASRRGGLLDFHHRIADEIADRLQRQFREKVDFLKNNSPSIPADGTTVRGVHHGPESKDYVWKTHLAVLAHTATQQLKESYEQIAGLAEESWRKLKEKEGDVEPEQMKRLQEAEFEYIRKNLEAKIVKPSQAYFEQEVGKRYNVIKAMKEELMQVRGILDEKKVEDTMVEEISVFFSSIVPFCKIRGWGGGTSDRIQTVGVLGFSRDSDDVNQFITRNITRIDKSDSPRPQALTGDDAASLDDKNELLFLRLLVGCEIEQFFNIVNYKPFYDRSIFYPHVDYRWSWTLPELRAVDDMELYGLFTFAELRGVLRLENEHGSYVWIPGRFETLMEENKTHDDKKHKVSERPDGTPQPLGVDFFQSMEKFREILRENKSMVYNQLSIAKKAFQDNMERGNAETFKLADKLVLQRENYRRLRSAGSEKFAGMLALLETAAEPITQSEPT